jgi:RNA polymerase sigma-70 factor (ECF subfamily)
MATGPALDDHEAELAEDLVPELGALDGRLDALVLELTTSEALDALSPAHRQALELAYQHDLSQSEIAERLGVPLGTVESQTHTALAAMREALADRGVDA